MVYQTLPEPDLLYTLFRGREDVFAIRWENENRSGYMPAYDFNRAEFAQHKAKGGTLKDFENKKYAPLTLQRIQNHLSGKETIGIYPLLADNTSWFIVADFDESLSGTRSWIEECRLLLNKCAEQHIPAYMERSRSGRGGHVWIFFDNNYPAFKSRKILLWLLEDAGISSPFDKNTNYDRLFPNQDYHSGKGLGNLIALPFQKLAMEQNNSCFIDAETEQPFPDQWQFLKTINKVSAAHLDEIYNRISGTGTTIQNQTSAGALLNDIADITLSNHVELFRRQLDIRLMNFLRDSLNFVNAEYIIRKKLGKSTFGIEPYFKMLTEENGKILLPRGFVGKLLRHCKEQNIRYTLHDERKKLTEIQFNLKATLYEPRNWQ